MRKKTSNKYVKLARKSALLIVLVMLFSVLITQTGSVRGADIDMSSISPSPGRILHDKIAFDIQFTSSDSNPEAYLYVDSSLLGNMTILSMGSNKYEAMYILDTRYFSDGNHVVLFKIIASDGNESISKGYVFDNSIPELGSFDIVYPEGQEAVHPSQYISIRAGLYDNISGIDYNSVTVSLSPLNNTTFHMYDDGNHNDGLAWDGIYGTDPIQINASLNGSGIYAAEIHASDWSRNEGTYLQTITLDNDLPVVQSYDVTYPDGQERARYGDKIRITAKLSDNTGVKAAHISTGSLNGRDLWLYDDGMHGDAYAGDGIWGTDGFTVLSKESGTVSCTIDVKDMAGNSVQKSISVSLDNHGPVISKSTAHYSSGSTAHYGDSIWVSAKISDNYGIEGVYADVSGISGKPSMELRDDGNGNDEVAGDGIFSSDSFSVNVISGVYEITIYADDSSGNIESSSVMVLAGDPLSVSISAPSSGIKVHGDYEINAMVSGPAPVDSVTLTMKDSSGNTVVSAPMHLSGGSYAYSLSTTDYSNGNYTIIVDARDSMGNSASDSISFEIENKKQVISQDSDGDGVPDENDTDRDGDGIPNDEDAFPDNPNEWRDTDKDGMGDNEDTDDDNDTWTDYAEEKYGTDPLDPSSHPLDTDGDHIADVDDEDDDNDGWSDFMENICGSSPSNASSVPEDTDHDGIPDVLDDDDDNDGYSDSMEAMYGTSPKDSSSYPVIEKQASQGEKESHGEMPYLMFVSALGWIAVLLTVALILRRNPRNPSVDGKEATSQVEEDAEEKP